MRAITAQSAVRPKTPLTVLRRSFVRVKVASRCKTANFARFVVTMYRARDAYVAYIQLDCLLLIPESVAADADLFIIFELDLT